MLLKGEIKDKSSNGRSGFRQSFQMIQEMWKAFSTSIQPAICIKQKDINPRMMHISHPRQTQANKKSQTLIMKITWRIIRPTSQSFLEKKHKL